MRLRARLAAVTALIATGVALPACGDGADTNRVEGAERTLIVDSDSTSFDSDAASSPTRVSRSSSSSTCTGST